jgi:hypothetical protein
MSYHLTPEGPKRCTASVRSCPLGGEHFGTVQEAEAAYAATFEDAGLKSVSANLDGKRSAEVSLQYTHWSILNRHMHNSGSIGEPQELRYYATPQGRLELARRSRERYPETYLAIAEQLDNEPADFDYDLDREKLDELVAEGEQSLQRDTTVFSGSYKKLPRDNRPLRHYLAEQSHKWMKRLTPEQQEAVSWHTSIGFTVSQHGLGIKNEIAHIAFYGLVDDDAIRDEYSNDWEGGEAAIEEARGAYSKAYLSTVNEAMALAPKLEKPVVISRGTSVHELTEILGASGEKDIKTLMDRVESGELTGKPVSEDARIAKLPLSASASPKIASGFSNVTWDKSLTEDRDVIVTIKARSFASPVNVSAWGAAEYEVLTNPTSQYRIAGGRRVDDDLFILELEEVE